MFSILLASPSGASWWQPKPFTPYIKIDPMHAAADVDDSEAQVQSINRGESGLLYFRPAMDVIASTWAQRLALLYGC